MKLTMTDTRSKSLLYIMLRLIVITYSDVHILTVIKYSITYWFY